MIGPARVPVDVVVVLVPMLMATLVASTLYVLEPPVDRRVVLSLTPWTVVGGAVHALYTTGVYPASFSLRPFFGPVTVYFTTFVAAGMVWAMMTTASKLAGDVPRDAQYMTAAGAGAALASLAIVLSRAGDTEAIVPAFAGLVVAALLAAVVYLLVTLVYTTTLIRTGLLGLVVIFAHALDGVIAAVGVGLLDAGPGDALSEWLIVRAADLPTAEVLGTAWLVVAARIGVAVVLVVAVASVIDRPDGRERTWVGHVGLGVVAAVGLGPGVHRFLSLTIG